MTAEAVPVYDTASILYTVFCILHSVPAKWIYYVPLTTPFPIPIQTHKAAANQWGGRGALLPSSLPHTYVQPFVQNNFEINSDMKSA
jgi:hypothetical protein